MDAIIAIVSYILICVLFLYMVKYERGIRFVYGRKTDDPAIERKHFVIYMWPLLTAFLFCFYNKFITGVQSRLTGDRMNYYIDFIYGRSTGFVLFDKFLQTVKSVTTDFSILLALVTLICCFFMLFALCLSKYCSIEAVLFLSASYFVFVTLTALKQSPVCALAALMFVLLIERKGIIYDIFAILIIIVSSCLHSTGFMLIPLYLLLKLNYKNKMRTTVMMIILVIAFVFFQPAAQFVSTRFANVIPIFGERVSGYLANEITVDAGDKSGFIILKGIPYYILAVIGLVDRKLHADNPHYDKYLILSVIGAISAMMSIYSYWYIRITYVFFLPFYILFSMIMSKRKGKDRIILIVLIIGSLAFFTFRSVILNYVNYGGY